MFKALLKTIPSLSGNMKLVCNLNGYKKLNKTSNMFQCTVNEAYLTTISNNLYDKNVNVNLKNNKYEYDVKKFFSYYSDIFYKSSYTFSKVNIPKLEFSKNLNDNDKDFLFGCKRVSFKKSKNTCAFFAPIYIESKEDLQGKYFVIKVEFKKVFTIVKYIKVRLDDIQENYLADYLNRYAEKIDDKVIYCSNTYKNIYYGISLLHGGFVRIEDNISSNLYKKYYTINDFDTILNNGFKRNSIMMKQILSLSFYFDPDDILSDTEKVLYNNSEMTISGKWYNNDDELKFYDFSDNYNKLYESIYTLGYNQQFQYTSTGYNIMNLPYPALNESTSENYKYINTLTKNYNRWKLKYSSDKYPYIINLNYAFSINQGSLYMYKEFPLIYDSIYSTCNLTSNTKYNLNYDFSNIYHSRTNLLINSTKKYLDLYNKNYISNFFNLILKKDTSETYINIFDDKYKDFWCNVNKDNKVYYKGVLYDFNKIYNQNPTMDFKIDKFSVFVDPHFSYVGSSDYKRLYKEAKFVVDKDNEIDKFNFDLSYLIQYPNIVRNNVLLINDSNGDYIKYKDSQYNNDSDNIYYSINDLSINYTKTLSNSDKDRLVIARNLILSSVSYVEGYRILDIYHKNNIIGDIYKNVEKYWDPTTNNFNQDGLIYRSQHDLVNETIYQLKDKLYFSIYPSKTKYKLLDNIDLIKNSKEEHIVVYIQDYFVKLKDIRNTQYDISVIGDINKYYFSNGLYNKKDMILYTDPSFVRLSKIEDNYGDIVRPHDQFNFDNENIIYVLDYNIDKLKKSVVFDYQENLQESITGYCKFLNGDNIDLFVSKNIVKFTDDILSSNILFKVKCFTLNNFLLGNKDDEIKDNYTNIVIKDDYIAPQRIGINNLVDFYKYVSYDDNTKLFNLNSLYFEDFNNGKLDLKDRSIRGNKLYDDPSTVDNPKTKQEKFLEIYPHFYYFELVFETTLIPLDEKLYHLILNRENDTVFKDLYLYHLYDPKDYISEMTYVCRERTTDNSDNIIDNIIDLKDNSELCFYPYFNSIYVENQQQTKIYSDYFLGNIVESVGHSQDLQAELYYNPIKYYRYNSPNIDLVVHKDYIESSSEFDEHYSLVSTTPDNIDNAYLFSQKFSNFEGIDNLTYNRSYTYINEYSGMITYNYNGTYYGFYIINSYFDNTKNTLNLVNEDNSEINCVDSINDISLQDLSKFSYSKLGINYKYLLPYIKTTNIVNSALNNIVPLCKPNNYKLKSQIIQSPNTDIYGTYSYTLYLSKKSTNIELSRYFDNIVPLIQETDMITSYYTYYKTTDKYIENDLYIKKLSYIIYEDTKSINKYSQISYFDDISYLSKANKYLPLEYKYYNDNKIINLEKKFSIIAKGSHGDNHYFYENELEVFENNQQEIIKLFSIYIKENSNLSSQVNEYNILFLYNKYSVKFSHIFKEIEKTTNSKLYKLTITFELL